MTQPQMNPGTILAGRWQIQDFIGSGEAGEVYGVRDMHSTGTFALKLLWPNALGQSELWSAVQQTARTASGLGVEGVARTHDFGIDANSGRPFFVAERVSWSSLADRVRLRGPLTPAEMATAFAVLARALDTAHGIGLVHRDLKPENVFVSPENAHWVRVSDFGVALLRSASPAPPGWGGTVGWVAPDATDPNARSTPAMDIFAMGLVTFFALSGGHLHRAARVSPIDPGALWQELGAPLDSASLRARELGASLDPAFDVWFQRAVSPNPQARFTSVGEMASAFEGIARTLFAPQSQNAVALEGVAAAIAQPLIFQPEAPPPATTPSVAPAPSLPTVQSAHYAPAAEVSAPESKKRNSAPLFIGGAVLCFGLTALGAVALYRQQKAGAPEATAEALASASAASSAALSAAPPAPSHEAAAAMPAAPPRPLGESAAAPSAPEPAAAPTPAAVPTPAPTAVASAKAASAAPTAASKLAAAPVVTPGTTAAKTVAAKTSAKTAVAANAVPAPVAAKPSVAAVASVKVKPGTLAAPSAKKKCGSVFLPCK